MHAFSTWQRRRVRAGNSPTHQGGSTGTVGSEMDVGIFIGESMC